MLKPIDNTWHVTVDKDLGTTVVHSWLTKDHAERLAALLNEIETARIERRGGNRALGDGEFYGVKQETKKWMSYQKDGTGP